MRSRLSREPGDRRSFMTAPLSRNATHESNVEGRMQLHACVAPGTLWHLSNEPERLSSFASSAGLQR
jgi:hypothetical protein